MKVKEVGNLTREPEYGEKGDIKYCRLNIAINDIYNKDKTEYAGVVAYGKKAEACRDYLQKGSMVCVEGNVKPSAYISQNDGKLHARMEITAEEVQFLARTKTREQTQELTSTQQHDVPDKESEPPRDVPPDQHVQDQQKLSIAERKATFSAQAKTQGNADLSSKDALGKQPIM